MGSPQEVIDKTLTFREHFGDYQRQLFLMDHAGLPLKTVLEQLDLLGEVVPVLRRELDALRPASVPDGPTHESLVAAARAATRIGEPAASEPGRHRGGDRRTATGEDARCWSEPPVTARTIAVVSAGLSQPSSTRLLADKLAAATAGHLPAGTEVITIELRDLAHDIVNALLTGFPARRCARRSTRSLRADALIAVTPLYSGSYNGLFKSFFDVLDPARWRASRSLIAATGGTARHSLALEHAIRPLFTYLRAVTVPTAVFAATEDWGAAGGSGDALTARIDRAGAELAALVEHRNPRRRGGPVRVRDPVRAAPARQLIPMLHTVI